MNKEKISRFPTNLAPILVLMRSQLTDEDREASYSVRYEDFVRLYREGVSVGNEEIDATFWKSLFDYCFSAEGIVDFLATVRRSVIGNVKNEIQYVREHNKNKYSLINDLPYFRDHIVSMATARGVAVDQEWLKTIEFINNYCRFKPYVMTLDDQPKLAAAKKVFGSFN